jgi:signal transduction histidine kinase
MTRTDLDALRLRQRVFEWELARDAQATAAAKLVSGKTHDLLNLVQIVQLATAELQRRTAASGQEFIDDLNRAAVDALGSLRELMEVARPDLPIVRGASVSGAIAGAIETIRPFVTVDIRMTIASEVLTRCTYADLEHLVIGLALDGDVPRIDLTVRERTIAGKPWVEILRGVLAGETGFELRVVEAIAVRAGGELSVSDAPGGLEVVVALPAC